MFNGACLCPRQGTPEPGPGSPMPQQPFGPMRAQWAMAQSGAEPASPLTSARSGPGEGEGDGQKLPGAAPRCGPPRPMSPFGRAGRPCRACFRHRLLRREPFQGAPTRNPNPNPNPNPNTGFCAENLTKEHICKNKQLLHFKTINQIPPFNKPAKPAGAGAAPKRKLQAPA